eukprot:2355065-Amphidinium_carterae.1
MSRVISDAPVRITCVWKSDASCTLQCVHPSHTANPTAEADLQHITGLKPQILSFTITKAYDVTHWPLRWCEMNSVCGPCHPFEDWHGARGMQLRSRPSSLCFQGGTLLFRYLYPSELTDLQCCFNH